MPQQVAFLASIAFSFTAWSIPTARFIWPRLARRSRVDALRPLLVLHSFRFVGLSFLVPGVTSPDVPAAFSHAAAFGDLVAAALAVLGLLALRRRAGIGVVWIFNLWGSADLLNAFYQAGHAGLVPGQLGATYFLPTLIVPLLLITHLLAFRILLRHETDAATRVVRAPSGEPSVEPTP